MTDTLPADADVLEDVAETLDTLAGLSGDPVHIVNAARLRALAAALGDEQAYIVIASGHGSAERPNYPPSLKLQTRAEAEADARGGWVVGII